ncbi:hypothetical protein [Alkalicoccus luteus]|uniref:Uncharacterized protein n=1 Tax=Alkalicoccus luteus TaxID=1237094 RepID=A0A969PSM4_9BACI|nr:hypothetical protein [Alkalicoccus luteus]NJP36799.1 hypothetical protein [Alkalicoccus luteus]
MRPKLALLACPLLFAAACSDQEPAAGDENNTDSLIKTNESLTDQLEKERNRTLELEEELAELHEENAELKDDLLTSKQETVDAEAAHRSTADEADQIESRIREALTAMHEQNAEVLEGVTSEATVINEEEAMLTFQLEEDETRSLHWVNLERMNLVQVREIDVNDDAAAVVIEFVHAAEEEIQSTGMLEAELIREEDEWKLQLMSYTQPQK